MLRNVLGALALVLLSSPAIAQGRCGKVLAQLSEQLADAVCVESTDLTTTNPATTPANNSIPGLPPGAFTPLTDRDVIAPSPAKRPPITKAVPGLQIQARFAADPTGQGRFLLRLPNDWNGRLVVAGASGTRSEFNVDIAWSDFVLQKGYAYASQNKGVLNLRITSLNSTTPPNPLACRLNPTSLIWVNFYDNDDGQPFTRWREFMIAAAKVAKAGVRTHYGHGPRHVYAVGTSNGGYQVRRAIETAPNIFDGGVDWEGTFVDENGPNILTDLPPAILNWPDYLALGQSATSTAAKNIRAAGFPPDIVNSPTVSFWRNHSNSFWEVTQCQWQKRLDPTFDTYASEGTATYNYHARRSLTDVGQNFADFATTGKIKRPLITVAGTMDALLPIDRHARAYARLVAARADDDDERGRDRRYKDPQYRLYEVQNGNHIETYQDTFPQLELIMPHAQRAFDLLVRHVEHRAPLPPDQCVGRGQTINDAPAGAAECEALLVP